MNESTAVVILYHVFILTAIRHCFGMSPFITALFSSPELIAQVSFSDRLPSVSVCLSVRPSVSFSYFQLKEIFMFKDLQIA